MIMGRTTPLKDQSGRTIGTVDDHGDGKRSIREGGGRTLGEEGEGGHGSGGDQGARLSRQRFPQFGRPPERGVTAASGTNGGLSQSHGSHPSRMPSLE